MARIILEHNGQVLKDFSLSKGSLTIGRREDNVIVLGDPQVSAYHARIDRKALEYILTDLQSTNGTFVNNLRIFSHRLRHGDRISISRYALLFIGTEKAKIEAELENIPLDRTVIIGGGTRHQKARPLTAQPLPQAAFEQPKSSGFLRKLLLVFLLVAVILGIGLWGFHDEPSFFRGEISKNKTNDHGDLSTVPIAKQESIPPEPENHMAEEIFEPGETGSGLIIDAIVWASNGAGSFALINGIKVTAGQSIEGMIVKEIGRDYVVLRPEDGESDIRLTLTLK
ncbi:MAG: FHA domain-containing protein [Deltaproteobacteria bacterium]|nr:FHA domain-containing protein [Deltaproteobacteria bacterium]